LDTTGRSYSLAANTLPSARGQGEPLTTKLSPPSGAQFMAVVMGDAARLLLLTSNAGYGFIAQLGDLEAGNKNGKALLNVPDGATVLSPTLIADAENDQLAVLSNTGRLLLFPVKDLPRLAKGKGNKLMSLLASDEEVVVQVLPIRSGDKLTVHAGGRHMTLTQKDLEHYQGERGRRGQKLPRGFQKVDGLSVS